MKSKLIPINYTLEQIQGMSLRSAYHPLVIIRPETNVIQEIIKENRKINFYSRFLFSDVDIKT